MDKTFNLKKILIEEELIRIARKEKRCFDSEVFWKSFEKLKIVGGEMLSDNPSVKDDGETQYGSHKQYGIGVQLGYMKAVGQKNAGISSSGNAAITALSMSKLLDINVDVFLSKETSREKMQQLSLLNETKVSVHVENDVQKSLNEFCAKTKARNLRPSLDPISKVGFRLLALDVVEKWESLNAPWYDSIFIFATSGASFLGLYDGFKILQEKAVIPKIPKLNLVRGEAGALGSSHSHLITKCEEVVKITHGKDYFISLEEIKPLLTNSKLEKMSKESVSAFYAWSKSQEKNALIISTGKKWI